MSFLKNKPARFVQGCYHRIRAVGAPFPIFIINKESVAAHRLPRSHIPPPIAHHKTICQVYPPFASCLKQHSRLGFAAITGVCIGVITHLDIIA